HEEREEQQAAERRRPAGAPGKWLQEQHFLQAPPAGPFFPKARRGLFRFRGHVICPHWRLEIDRLALGHAAFEIAPLYEQSARPFIRRQLVHPAWWRAAYHLAIAREDALVTGAHELGSIRVPLDLTA